MSKLMKTAYRIQTVILAFLICCTSSGTIASNEPQSESLDKEIEKFKKDNLGCLGLRTEKNIKFIYKNGQIKGKTKSELLKLAGAPNDSAVANGLLNYRYYFGRTCAKGIPVDSVDSCWSTFHIEISTRKVSDISYVCQ